MECVSCVVEYSFDYLAGGGQGTYQQAFPSCSWKRKHPSGENQGAIANTHFAHPGMVPQGLFQSIPKGPLQQSTRSTGPNHHSHLLAKKEDTDCRCQLRFLYASRNRDELRRVEQANAETGGKDIERLPYVDRAPPSEEYEDKAHDTSRCSHDGHDLVPLCPGIYMASEVPEFVDLSAGSRPRSTYLLIMCPPRIAPIAFPTGATVIWSAATVFDAFSVRAKNAAILDRIFRPIS